jgi:hypothetical protein
MIDDKAINRARDLIEEVLDEVLNTSVGEHIRRVDTAEGITIIATPSLGLLGKAQILFPWEPLALNLLQTYPETYAENGTIIRPAAIVLDFFLSMLSGASSVGMLTVIQLAESTASEVYESMQLMAAKQPLTIEHLELRRAKRQGLLARIRHRYKLFLITTKRGVEAQASILNLTIAIMTMRMEGEADTDITLQKVALRIGCTDHAVYKALERARLSWADLMQGRFRPDN